MKKKFTCLGLAVMMLLSITGCSIKTPATVGSIGGVDIPAGVYLLAQYNAYSTASSNAKLATGETASNVSAVLKAECTGTIGDQEVTETGKEYVAALTQRSIEYYAAVESKFAELGGTLDDTATSEVATNLSSLWDSNGKVYQANGIGKSSLEAYLLNTKKATAIEQLLYGENGTQPVAESEYEDFIKNQCCYLDVMVLPLYDSSSYVFASEEQSAQIDGLADEAIAALSSVCTPETSSAEAYSYLYLAAAQYIPEVYQTLGVTSFDSSTAGNYVGSQLYTPSTLTSYDDGAGGNKLTDAVNALANGEWGKVNLGTSILVFRKMDPLAENTVSDLVKTYSLLDELKSKDVQNMLYEQGAAMEHNLSASAMNTYKAAKIKKSV